MGKKSPPKPPDPRETAAAATSTNVGTSIANAYLMNNDQITPQGTRTSQQIGTYGWHDPYTGKTYQIPRFKTTDTLSPQQMAIFRQQEGADLNLASLGNRLSGTLGKQLTGNFKLGNAATEGRLFELGRKRLDPRFDQEREQMETRLASRGIGLGTKAYDTAMRQFGETKNDAYNQLLLQGRGMASQELLTEDNQRINQISALLNGGQVSQPNFTGQMNISPIPTTDVGGLINDNYNQRMAGWQQSNQQRQGLLGGLFSLGSGFLYSDRRLKTDAKRIGWADNGLPIYIYRYRAGGPATLGFMADEVEAINPGAVIEHDGYKAVNYEAAVQ